MVPFIFFKEFSQGWRLVKDTRKSSVSSLKLPYQACLIAYLHLN